MNKYSILVLISISFLIISCENHHKTKNNTTDDPLASDVNSKKEDSSSLKFPGSQSYPATANRDTQSFPSGRPLKTDDYIKQYPANQKAELRRHIDWLRKEWRNVPNPITATYQGNDLGDYHHILFKAANGAQHDFGQAKNNYGQYDLHELSGQYKDNPDFLGKEFNVYWDWKLSEFLCCDGEYGKAKAYLPSITKLELIKK